MRKIIYCIAAVAILINNSACSIFRAKDLSYSHLVEPFEDIDTLPLEGRVIVLDPGHGGTAPGAVGAAGLEEKQVNLQVALRLQYYLEKADAQVIMTRNEDRNLIIDRIDSLRGNDLDYRVRLSNDVEADLFISLHHNSNLSLDRDYSAVETYYKMEDYFSSKDAAKLIHKHLVRNLQIPLNFLRPGNYYVLRNNFRTAVLGEASYISNLKLEKKLSKFENIEIEAKSYFLGILDYFSRGIPKIENVSPEMDAVIDDALPVIKISVLEDQYGDGIDPQSIFIGIDDTEIPYTYEPAVLTAAPIKPLSNGIHRVFVNVANLKGNHSLLYESRFVVDVPPSTIIVTHNPESIPPDGHTPMTLTALVLDKHYNAVNDSTPVYFSIDDNPAFKRTTYTRDGLAYFYFTHDNECTLPYTVQAGEITKQGTISVKPQDNSIITLSVIANNPNKTKSSPPVQPLENVRVDLNRERFSYTNRDGYLFFDKVNPGTYTLTAHLSGYYPASIKKTINNTESVVENIVLEPLYDGLLFGKIILVDPEFGGLASGSIGPSGLRAADENIETAHYLVQYLRMAGANAQLTINHGEDLTTYSRVRLANEIGAQLFVSLRHISSSNPTYTGISTYAYPTGTEGKRLGTLVLNSFKNIFNLGGYGPVEAADFVLQQTGCPAVIINLGNVSNPSTEEALYETWRNRLEAYTVFTALVNYYAGENIQWGEFSGIIADQYGKPVHHALVSLDQIIVLQTDTNGRFKFTTLEPRNYSVSIQAKGYNAIQENMLISPSKSVQKKFTLTRKQ